MKFIPALKHEFLTPVYDVAIRLTVPELRFKKAVIHAAAIRPGNRVLDVGCGTATLILIAHAECPGALFTGIDPDLTILRRARRKAPHIAIETGSATELPFADAAFDRVLSTLVFHHLTRVEKAASMREVLRVLRPAGEFHLGDFGAPDSFPLRVASFLTEKIGREHVVENYRGLLPSMLRDAGFSTVEETGRFATMFGVLRSIRAVKSAA